MYVGCGVIYLNMKGIFGLVGVGEVWKPTPLQP